ncbi:MAG: prephenate dehydratase domain-containing protein [Gemmatimonadaceae bacterium]
MTALDTPGLHASRPNEERSPRVVAFQGERGAYGDLAIDQRWGSDVLREPCWDFEGVIASVVRGAADAGVLPVTNVIVGNIPGVKDAIARSGLQRVDTVTVPVRHCLLGVRGSDVSRIRIASSHAVALAQCAYFFARHAEIEARARYDTAGAAREVAARRTLGEAAVASAECAARYGLVILERDIGDRSDNATTFAVIVRER